jgi:plastocyanin
MRVRLLLALAAVMAITLAVAPALADQQIVAGVTDRFLTTAVTIAQGEQVTFHNTDLATHDVTSDAAGPDGAPLFDSAQIGLNKTAVVEGTQYLKTGTYTFFCSIHPFMKGTLTVSSDGTPVPRPGSATPPPADALTVAASRVRSSMLGRITLRVKVSGPATVTVRARATGTATLASATAHFAKAGARTVALRLTRAGRSALRHHSSVAVTIALAARDAAGHTAGAGATARLLR